jgi:hypothetical protein
MPVEITNQLTPEMQFVADCRELVRKLEADVEEKKSALKLSKAALESAQEDLNSAVDSAIEAGRQPTLFDKFADTSDDLPAGPRGRVTVEVTKDAANSILPMAPSKAK